MSNNFEGAIIFGEVEVCDTRRGSDAISFEQQLPESPRTDRRRPERGGGPSSSDEFSELARFFVASFAFALI